MCVCDCVCVSTGASLRILVVAIVVDTDTSCNKGEQRRVFHCANLLKLVRIYSCLFILIDGMKTCTVKRSTNSVIS